MALRATVYKAELAVSDLDHGVHGQHPPLTLARATSGNVAGNGSRPGTNRSEVPSEAGEPSNVAALGRLASRI